MTDDRISGAEYRQPVYPCRCDCGVVAEKR